MTLNIAVSSNPHNFCDSFR